MSASEGYTVREIFFGPLEDICIFGSINTIKHFQLNQSILEINRYVRGPITDLWLTDIGIAYRQLITSEMNIDGYGHIQDSHFSI